IDVVAPHLRVQVGRPVPPDRAVHVALLVGLGVLVHLDHPDSRVPHVLFEPVGLDERVGGGVSRHLLLLPIGTPATRKGAAARPLRNGPGSSASAAPLGRRSGARARYSRRAARGSSPPPGLRISSGPRIRPPPR